MHAEALAPIATFSVNRTTGVRISGKTADIRTWVSPATTLV